MSKTGKHTATGGPDKTATAADRQPMRGHEATSESEIRLDEQAQELIGRQLKAVYGAIVQEPIPDRFLELLENLERKEQER